MNERSSSTAVFIFDICVHYNTSGSRQEKEYDDDDSIRFDLIRLDSIGFDSIRFDLIRFDLIWEPIYIPLLLSTTSSNSLIDRNRNILSSQSQFDHISYCMCLVGIFIHYKQQQQVTILYFIVQYSHSDRKQIGIEIVSKRNNNGKEFYLMNCIVLVWWWCYYCQLNELNQWNKIEMN